jgi:glycosyltransferase involved in cell wall biosynthesis
VTSDIEGYRDAAADHARLVKPADPAALAEALEGALSDAAAGRGLSSPEAVASARQWAEGWSMAKLAGQYLEIYERVLAERRGPAPSGQG